MHLGKSVAVLIGPVSSHIPPHTLIGLRNRRHVASRWKGEKGAIRLRLADWFATQSLHRPLTTPGMDVARVKSGN